MARIDVEIEDYLDEVDTKYLVAELKKRKDAPVNIDWDDIEIPKFKHSEQLLDYIRKLLRLRKWHNKDRIIDEIKLL